MKKITIAFQFLIGGLLLSTLYYCQKENQKLPPSIEVKTISEITSRSAVLKGQIKTNGSTVDYCGVCWSQDPNPTIEDNKTSAVIESGLITTVMSGLNPLTTYHIRAYAVSGTVTSYSPEIKITTTEERTASLTTAAVSNITNTSATCGGTISNTGGAEITARGVCWSISENPTIENFKTSDGNGIGSFTSSIAGLFPGTVYYVRAYSTNSAGTGYGNQVTFTTSGEPATVTLAPLTDITGTSVRVSALLVNNGGVPFTEKGFCWSNLPNPTITNQHIITYESIGFKGTVFGLTPNAKYYIRAYAKNASGIIYSNELSCTTLKIAPIVTTWAIQDITTTAAKCSIKIVHNEGIPLNGSGVCWNTSETPTIQNFKTNDGDISGTYISSLTNLNPGRVYYVRAYATDNDGTVYGRQIWFNTPAQVREGCEIIQVRYGTSFNMCAGYCVNELKLQPESQIFKKQGWSGTPAPVSCQAVLDAESWTAVKKVMNIQSFFDFPAVFGCPDCADGGAEWIEITLNSGETHRVVFQYDNVPVSLKDFSNLLRSIKAKASQNCQ